MKLYHYRWDFPCEHPPMQAVGNFALCFTTPFTGGHAWLSIFARQIGSLP
jgi:hypothetical protein